MNCFLRRLRSLLADNRNAVKICAISLLILLYDKSVIQNFSVIDITDNEAFLVAFPSLLQLVLYTFFIVSSLNPETYSRVFFSVIVFFSFFIDFAYKSISGEVVALSDIDLMIENYMFADRAASMFFTPVKWALLKSFTITFFYVLPPKKKDYKKTEIFAYYLPLFVAIPLISVAVKDFNEFSFAIPAVPRIISYSVLSFARPMKYGLSEKVDLPLSSPPKIKNIVLIVDESVSSDFVNSQNELDLNLYKKYHDCITDFSPAHSGGNCTRSSRSYLRFAVAPDDLKKEGIKTLQKPNLWSYARKAGYKTYLMGYNPVNDSYLGQAEIKSVDYFDHMSEAEYGVYLDKKLGEKLRQAINKGDSHKLIIVMKSGSHFSYDNNYPKEEKIYSPVISDGGDYTKEKMLNSYRNSLKWATDSFFDELFADGGIDLDNTFIIYTSDHGQNFTSYEDFVVKVPITHCSPSNPPDKEFEVPLIVLTKNKEAERINKKYKGQASHFNIVPTILDLMGYEKSKTESLFSDDLKCYPSFYNDPYGRFGKLKIKEYNCQ